MGKTEHQAGRKKEFSPCLGNRYAGEGHPKQELTPNSAEGAKGETTDAFGSSTINGTGGTVLPVDKVPMAEKRREILAKLAKERMGAGINQTGYLLHSGVYHI